MVEITFRQPTRLQTGEIGGPYGYLPIWASSGQVLVFRTVEYGRHVKYDIGSMVTSPSSVHRENNCFHYDGDGYIEKVYLNDISYRTPKPSNDYSVSVTVTTPKGTYTFRRVFAICMDATVVWSSTPSKEVYWNSVHYPWFTYFHQDASFRVRSLEGNKLECSFDVNESVYELNGSMRREVSEYNGVTYPAYKDDRHWCNLSDYWTWSGSGDTSETYEMIKELYSDEFGGASRLCARLEEVADEVYDDGELTLEGVENVRLTNINTVLYVKDFVEIKSLATSLTEFASAELKLKPVLKAASAAYLALHYGVRLTRQDTDELAEGIDAVDFDHQYQTVGSEHTEIIQLPGHPDVNVQVNYRLTARIHNWTEEQLFFLDKVKQLKRTMYEWDVVPSLANVWDAIPFSFLVDWIVPIGDQAERLESEHYMQTLELDRAFYSRKYTWSQHLKEVSLNGNLYRGRIDFRYYRRRVQTSFTEPSFRAERPKGSFTHVVEGSALYVQLFG